MPPSAIIETLNTAILHNILIYPLTNNLRSTQNVSYQQFFWYIRPFYNIYGTCTVRFIDKSIIKIVLPQAMATEKEGETQ